jgi:hypothetical protein
VYFYRDDGCHGIRLCDDAKQGIWALASEVTSLYCPRDECCRGIRLCDDARKGIVLSRRRLSRYMTLAMKVTTL